MADNGVLLQQGDEDAGPSIEEILGHGRMVNDTQTLAHYSRILLAIRDAKQLGRLSDLLTDERINALMEIVPRKENGYWRHDLTGVRPKDRPVAFYSFVRLRALELGSNTSPFRFLHEDPEESEPAWEGPCLMGDLCGGSHAPEKCNLFVGLSPGDRLWWWKRGGCAIFASGMLTTSPARCSLLSRPVLSEGVCGCTASCCTRHCRRKKPER